MKVFAIIRRMTWGLILAGCVVVALCYLAIAQNFLDQTKFRSIVTSANLATTVRNTVVIPKMLSEARTTDYASLVDETLAQNAFDAVFTQDALNKKITPIADAISQWLDSKQPDIAFSVDFSQDSDALIAQLAKQLGAKLAAQPTCTNRNTLDDIEAGVCHLSTTTEATLTATILAALQDSASFKDTTVTADTLPALVRARQSGSELPEYLNMFYALSLVAAATAVLVILWLLVKHRASGIVTIGGAFALAGVILLIAASQTGRVFARLSSDSLSQQVMAAAASALHASLQQFATLLVIGGVSALFVGCLLLAIVIRHHQKHAPASHRIA